MTHQNDYTGLDKIQIAAKEGGKPVMTFALSAFLLFRGSETRDGRMAMLEALTHYYAGVPDQITHFQKQNAKQISAIPPNGFKEAYAAEIAKIDPDVENWAGTIGTPDPLHQYGATCMTTYGNSAARNPLGHFRAWYPCAYAKTNTDKLIADVLKWCDLLKPEQGQIGLVPLFEWGMERSYADTYWPFLARFNGLEFNTAFGVAVRAERGVKSVNWLTVLDDAYVDQLGGLDVLAPLLGPNAVIHQWIGGILIQAGAEPQIGDTNVGVWPAEYIAVNNALRPIRFEAFRNSPMSLIKVPPPLDAHEETLKWVRRFDREG